MDELGDFIKGIKAQEIVVIFDCCHSGGIAGGTVSFFWSDEFRDETFSGWKNVYIIAAVRGREEAGEVDSVGGLFLQSFCDALRGKGVTPDGEGRISAQVAWAHTTHVASEWERLHGHVQLAVSTSPPTGPIYLTCVDRMRRVRALAATLALCLLIGSVWLYQKWTTRPLRLHAVYVESEILPADLYVDGKKQTNLGKSSPGTSLELPTGEHELVLVQDGKKWPKTVSLSDGDDETRIVLFP
jgi:hypothetical protein